MEFILIYSKVNSTTVLMMMMKMMIVVHPHTGPDAQLLSRRSTQRPLLPGHHL